MGIGLTGFKLKVNVFLKNKERKGMINVIFKTIMVLSASSAVIAVIFSAVCASIASVICDSEESQA